MTDKQTLASSQVKSAEKDIEKSLKSTKPTLPLKGYIYQYALALSATFSLLAGGSAFGWTSPSLPILMGKDSPIPITSDEGSWIVVFMVVGTITSPIPAGWMMDKFGRKKTLLASAVPLIIAWILIGVAESVEVLYISRAFSGLTYGTVYSVAPMYLGEIASDSIRGSIGTLITVMAKTGILYVYAIGPYVTIKSMAWIELALPIIFLLTFIWFPETPYFLLGRGRDEEARKCLSKLRGHNDVQSELEGMKLSVELSQQNKGTVRELFSTGNRRALIICLGLGAAQQLCGSQAIIAYSQIIFERIGSDLKASDASIILAVVQVVTAGISSSIVDRLGRRPLLIMSAVGTTICNFIVGLYFYLIRIENDVTSITWLPMLAIMVFIVTYTIGLATVTFPLLGELFPAHMKALAGSSFTIMASLAGFGVSKLFQVVSDDLGSDFTFWGLAILSFLIFIFTWFLIPETKGKPLHVILEEMNGKKK